MTLLSSRYRRHQLAVQAAHSIARAINETGLDFQRPTRATAAGDSLKLRGIPVCGRTVGGAIRGTRPGGLL